MTGSLENSAPLSIVSAGPELAASWDAFVASRADGSFYHLYAWRGLNESEFGHRCEYLAAQRGDVIEGVLPLVLVRSRLFGRILCSMPFLNYGGPIGTPAAVAALTRRAAELADSLGADYLELRCAQPVETTMPVSTRKISMTIDLNSDPQVLWNAFSSKHRNNVRRAQKNGLEVRTGGIELAREFYDVLELSWRSLGTPLYRFEYFKRVLETFPQHTCIHICHQKDRIAAVTFNGQFNGTVEGMWAAMQPELRQLQPNYVLYWEMMRLACTQGFRKFHLGRSTANSGAEDFKAKWNAHNEQLYWYYHLPRGGELPQFNVENPKFRLAIAAWRKMPLWATRIVGPRVARGIP